MSCVQDVTAAGVIAARTNHQPEIDGLVLLADPARHYMAKRAIDLGQGTPAEVAAIFGICANELCALLGIQADA